MYNLRIIAEQEKMLEGFDTAKKVEKMPHDVQILKDMILQQRQEISKKDKDIDILEEKLLDLQTEKGDLWVKKDEVSDNEELIKNKKIIIKLTEENEGFKEVINNLRLENENIKEREESKKKRA